MTSMLVKGKQIRQYSQLTAENALSETANIPVPVHTKSLRRRYYEKKVQALHDADSHSWWNHKLTKKIISSSDSYQLSHLSAPRGETLANATNSHFVSVSQDLPPKFSSGSSV